MTLFRSTVGCLLNKARNAVAENLRHGDVFDQLLSHLVSNEFNDINSKLNGLAQQHLGAAISAYSEGVILTAANLGKDKADGPGPAKKPKLDSLESFKIAQVEALIAFNNPNLTLSKRLLALYIRVMTTLFETKDNPTEALVLYKKYIEEMHALGEVKSNFKLLAHDTIEEKAKKILRKKKFCNIISSVYQMNRIVFGITQMIGVCNPFSEWPTVTWNCRCSRCVCPKIDPLHDNRVREILPEEGVPFDEIDAQDLEILEEVVATPGPSDTQDQCLEVDNIDIKVFDCSRHYQDRLLSDQVSGLLRDHKFPAEYHPVDIETDQNGKVYLLVRMVNKSHKEDWYEVVVLDNDAGTLHTFRLRNKSRGRKLAVNQHGDNTEVLVLVGEEGQRAAVQVYKTDGEFVCPLGGAVLQDAQDIAVANNGHVYVLDKCHESEENRGVKRKLSYE